MNAVTAIPPNAPARAAVKLNNYTIKVKLTSRMFNIAVMNCKQSFALELVKSNPAKTVAMEKIKGIINNETSFEKIKEEAVKVVSTLNKINAAAKDLILASDSEKVLEEFYESLLWKVDVTYMSASQEESQIFASYSEIGNSIEENIKSDAEELLAKLRNPSPA